MTLDAFARPDENEHMLTYRFDSRGGCTRLPMIVGIVITLAGCGDDGAAPEPAATNTLAAATSTATTPAFTTVPPATVPPTAVPSTATPTVPPSAVPATSDPAATIEVSAYFVRDEHVALVHRTVPATPATTRAAFAQLLAGTQAREQEIGLSSAVPEGTFLNGASIENGVATIDLSSSFGGGGGLSMRLRLAQVVYTATQFETVEAVLLELDGAPLEVFGSDGLVLDQPLTRADFEDETPAIFVDTPAPFDPVGPTLRVSGTSNVFEATFMVRVVDVGGTTRYEHFQMATSGTGTRGTFDFTVDVTGSTPGPSLLRLWEPSSMDGSDTNVVEIPLQL